MSTPTTAPAGWKTYDEFATGIATNRLPASTAPIDLRTCQTCSPSHTYEHT